MGSFFKQDRTDEGKLYIIKTKFREEEDWVYKIGVTTKEQPIDRLLEILRSHFMINRYIPECTIKRFKTVTTVYSKETKMHKYFKEQQYIPEKKFQGSTEYFKVNEELLLQVYKDCIEGTDINSEEYEVVLETESGEDRKE